MADITGNAAAAGESGVDEVRCRVLPDGRMSREDAARYLGLRPKTLAMWALNGKGPRSVKVGARRFYYRADLDVFIRTGETSDAGAA